MNRDGKQITLDYWRPGIVFMKMLIVSARLIPGVGGRVERGQGSERNQGATDRTSTTPLTQIIAVSQHAAFNTAPWL